MPSARNSRLFTNLLLFLFVVVAPLSAQITYETTYTTQTQNNTSACSSAGGNNGGCTGGANTITGTKNNNPIPINTSKINPRTLFGSWFTGNIYGADMGWWQKPGHLCCVGYSSKDATEVQAQLQDMKSRGYAGMTMAWAGVNGSTCTVAGGTATKIFRYRPSKYGWLLPLPTEPSRWQSGDRRAWLTASRIRARPISRP